MVCCLIALRPMENRFQRVLELKHYCDTFPGIEIFVTLCFRFLWRLWGQWGARTNLTNPMVWFASKKPPKAAHFSHFLGAFRSGTLSGSPLVDLGNLESTTSPPLSPSAQTPQLKAKSTHPVCGFPFNADSSKKNKNEFRWSWNMVKNAKRSCVAVFLLLFVVFFTHSHPKNFEPSPDARKRWATSSPSLARWWMC